MRVLSYIWNVFSSIVKVLFVWWVFMMIEDRNTRVIVAVLGLMYTGIGTATIMSAMGQAKVAMIFQAHLDRIEARLDGVDPVDRSGDAESVETASVKMYIAMSMFVVISVTCLAVLFFSLQR